MTRIWRCMRCGWRTVPVAGVCHRCQATLPTNGGQAEDTAAENFAGDELAIPGYRIEELLGSGGFGQVVAAVPGVEKDALPTRVAIKIARRDPPQAAAQLRSEARVLAAIGAPAVPALHDQGVLDDGSPYLVMEHIAGPLLATTLARREAPIAGDEFITLATAITRSVARVHDRGFVHRDLKPENIIIAATPLRAVLLDLGLAMPLAAEPVAQPIDRPERGEDTGPAEGTVEYMAPEQCAGPGPADARSDLYALGVVLFEMATGRPPFFGVAAEVYEAHLSRRPPRPSTLAAVSSAAEAIILRCLAKDPAQRYADAHRVIAALQQAAGDRAPSDLSRPGTQPVPDTANRPGRRRASTARSQEKVAILWLRSRCEVAVVEAVIERRQGQIVHLTTGGYVAVFPPQRDHHPLEMAVAACRELCDREVGERMAIELAPVKVRVRSGGTRRYFSTLFGREDRFPRLSDPPGITVGAAAARARPHPLMPALPGRDDGTQLISWPDLRTGRRDTSGDTEVLDQTALQRSVPLIGRDAVLAEILAGAERALAGRAPTLCTVVAEPGFGKSHVCAELRARLREPDEDGERVGGADDTQPWVIALRARAPVAGGRRHTVRELLMQLLDLPAELPEVGFAPLFARRLGAELADALGVSLALALGWLSADSPQARGLAVAPGALRTAAARATSAVLRHLAERRPLAILIDDAHAADQVTLDALELATLAEGGAAIWVCVLARPSLDRIRPEWGRRSAASPRFDLGPLDTEAAAALCRCLLQPIERIPALAIDRLVARTQGIPLLMVELVRGLRAEGLVRQHESGAPYIATDEIERLPDVPVLEWLAGRELEALPAELASHAYLIALMNGDVTGLEVIGVLAEIDSAGHIAHFPLDPMVATRRLLDASLLVMHRDGRFGFRSDVLRDTVARSAPDQLPQVVHQAAFRFYRASTALHPLTRLARLAFHAERAGVHQQAVRTYLDLAERATTRHDYLEAEILYTRVLDALARNDSRDDARDDSRDDARDDSRHDARDLASDRRAQDSADADEGRHRDRSRRMAAHRGRGLMRYRLGRYQDSLSDFASARVLAAELGEEAAEIEILLDEATALDWCDEWQTSAQRTEEARRLAGQLFNAQIEARLLMAEGRSLWRQNRNRAAFDLLDQAESLAERMGDEAYETFVISLLVCGYLKVVLGDFEHAEHRFGRVIPLCQERGDMMHLAAALGNRAFLWIAKNDIERMLDDQRKLLELSRELGNARMEQHANFYLGQYLLWTGEVAKAKGHAQRARDIDEHRLANTARQESALLVARVLAASGDRSEARRALEWIRSRREQATLRSGSDPELVPLEEAQFAMVDLAIRDDYDEGAWDELEAEVETLASGRERLELLELRALSAVHCDRVDDARQVLKRAATIAADIPDVLGEQRARIERRLEQLGDAQANRAR